MGSGLREVLQEGGGVGGRGRDTAAEWVTCPVPSSQWKGIGW